MDEKRPYSEITQEEFERVEAYILGTLSSDQKDDFEEQLAQDEKLATHTEEIASMIRASQASALRLKLDDFHEEMDKNATPITSIRRKGNIWKYAGIAAAIILFLLGSYYITSTNPENQDLFAQYYEADPGLITRMSEEGNYNFNRAMVDYKSGNYVAAIEVWESMKKINPTNDSINYFLGSAYLAKKSPSEAISYFKQNLEQDNSTFREDCIWYLALAYININDIEQAKVYLAQSSRPEAQNLLATLKE